MQNKFLILFILIFLVSGCTDVQLKKSGTGEVTPDKILAERGAPAVGTLEDALLKSAQESSQKREYKKAAQLYLQLSQRVPDNDVYQLAHAESLRLSGDFKEAQKAFDAIVRKHPESLSAHEGRGLTLLASGEVDDAIKVLTPILQRDETRWRTANAIGIALSIKKQHDQALYYYRNALQHSENNPSILNNLGLTLAINEDYERAVKSLDMAQKYVDKSDSNSVKKIATNLAMVYALSGDMTKAENTARPHMTESELYNTMGHFAKMTKDSELAKTYLNMALSSSKQYYDTAWKNLEAIDNKR